MKTLIISMLAAASAMASVVIVEKPNAISAELNGKTLWTYHHDPAEGKPYIHPLASTDGTVFTDLRPADHPWHRAVWFSWKHINGVNYWEEDRKTHKSPGETRIVRIDRTISTEKNVHLKLDLVYAPAGTDDIVLKENRTLVISAPDADGVYHIKWSSTFHAQEKDAVLERTPVPGEPNGKNHGGYAGWSVRMNKNMLKGRFINSAGKTNAPRAAAKWNVFQADEGGGLVFRDHPDNISHPSTKWYVAKGMPYFSPAVIYDAPYTIKAGKSLTLKYSLLVCPGKLALKKAEPKRKKVVILTGANNHNWKATTPVLENMLARSGRFEVDVVSEPEKLTPELLGGCDVLLSNWNGFVRNKPAPWSAGLKKAYVDFVRNGGGHVVVHAGSCSHYDWADYHAISLATWKGATGHKSPHAFEVRIADKRHPITAGMKNFKITDELWFKPFVQPGAAVIAESFSQHTGNWEPTALTGAFGKGRCFTLLLGHSAGFMQNEGFKALLISGTEWAASLR